MTPTLQQLITMLATREQIESWAAQQARAVPAGPQHLLCRVLGKHLMYVLQNDTALTPHLAMSGIWEPWVSMAIARHVKPGMRCMDVGACYGYYSLLMADIVGDQGYVEAWEPVHTDLLRTNTDVNGAQVCVMGYAMGEPNGDMAVFDELPKNSFFNAGGVAMRRAHPIVGSLGYRKAFRGPERSRYDFIKIDVEGAEADVWRALDRVKAESPDLTVCMEFTPQHHENPVGFLTGIVMEGFSIGTVGHDGFTRPCSIEEAATADTGDFRMLWLNKDSE